MAAGVELADRASVLISITIEFDEGLSRAFKTQHWLRDVLVAAEAAPAGAAAGGTAGGVVAGGHGCGAGSAAVGDGARAARDGPRAGA